MKRQTRFCRLYATCPFMASIDITTNRKLSGYNPFADNDKRQAGSDCRPADLQPTRMRNGHRRSSGHRKSSGQRQVSPTGEGSSDRKSTAGQEDSTGKETFFYREKTGECAKTERAETGPEKTEKTGKDREDRYRSRSKFVLQQFGHDTLILPFKLHTGLQIAIDAVCLHIVVDHGDLAALNSLAQSVWYINSTS